MVCWCMDSYVRVVVCVVWSVPLFMNLRRTSNASGGDSLELRRHCVEYTEPLRTTDSGCFSSLGGGVPDCHCVIKYYEESSNLVQVWLMLGNIRGLL